MSRDPIIRQVAGELEARAKRIGRGYLVCVLSVLEDCVVGSAYLEHRGDHSEYERLMREPPRTRSRGKDERGR